MQKFCPILELTRLIYKIISIIRPPNKQEHKTTQRRKKCSRTTDCMVLIRNFHVFKREGTRQGFKPSILRIAVLNLTNCAITTTYHRFSKSVFIVSIHKFQIDIEQLISHKNQKVKHEKNLS